jgi:hypothetical protein
VLPTHRPAAAAGRDGRGARSRVKALGDPVRLRLMSMIASAALLTVETATVAA